MVVTTADGFLVPSNLNPFPTDLPITVRRGNYIGATMKRLKSVLTDDMNHCMYTGSPVVERHHVFGSYNKERSEKYGFIAPLRPDYHPNGSMVIEDIGKRVDIELKTKCQRYYEEHIGNRQQFIDEFGRNYLDIEDKELD